MVNIQSYTLFIALFLQKHVLGGSRSLVAPSRWCYECGTGVTGTKDCLEFAMASSWKPFLRECSDDQVCVKIVPAWNSSLYSRTQRGCTPQQSLNGFKHQPGCWGSDGTSFITCFCYEDSCNGHMPLQAPQSLAFVLILGLLILL
ncbi:unnamed protein product [Meganyctiphanes norvegica]|uniref:Protein sleepless n=1 Tax=Meganyctiphanes norvegica TaxID=48144 RepID=A0AAV2PXT5_MEGNR